MGNLCKRAIKELSLDNKHKCIILFSEALNFENVVIFITMLNRNLDSCHRILLVAIVCLYVYDNKT